MRILVVEDETGVRDLLRRWLERWGYEVNTASSATEAEAVHTGAGPV